MQPEYIIYKTLAYHFGDITAPELKVLIREAARHYRVVLKKEKSTESLLELLRKLPGKGIQWFLPRVYEKL
jgi:hypothetical protein